jgi:helix-turn-helix protein
MNATWDLVMLGLSHRVTVGVVSVAGLLFLGGTLALRVLGMLLAFRLSRAAIEQGYPVEAASGREFYFRITRQGLGPTDRLAIERPRPTISGARLKTLRGGRKHSLASLAKALNISASRLSAFETGRAPLLDMDINAIADVLHLSAEEITTFKLLASLDAKSIKEK